MTNFKHGQNTRAGVSPIYRTWVNMTARCKYSYKENYHRYGGRGITVCDRWKRFENFWADMGDRPPGRTLDRINNDGNYEPGNCRWATPQEQMANRGLVTGRRFLTYRGRTQSLAAWSRELGFDYQAMYRAIVTRRQPFEPLFDSHT